MQIYLHLQAPTVLQVLFFKLQNWGQQIKLCKFFKNVYLYQNYIKICLKCLEALQLIKKYISFSLSRTYTNFSEKVFQRPQIRSF